MKTHLTVETEKRAKEVINDHVQRYQLTDGRFENTPTRCGCGETQAINWYNGRTLITVGVCKSCGDDTHSSYEVMNIR